MRAGGWEYGVWAISYLICLPRTYMRVSAGFGNSPGSYYLKRGGEKAPRELTMLLWPWVEGALAAYEDSQVLNADEAGQHFLELLM